MLKNKPIYFKLIENESERKTALKAKVCLRDVLTVNVCGRPSNSRMMITLRKHASAIYSNISRLLKCSFSDEIF